MELLVIAILLTVADAQQISCDTSCKTDKTAEGDTIQFTCKLNESPSGAQLTWKNKLTEEELLDIPSQNEEGGAISRDFPRIAVAPSMAPLVCSATIPDNADANIVPCETHQCNILYSVKTVVTLPPLLASPGEQITCIADGNPKPSFAWQWKEEDGVGDWMNIPGKKSDKIEAPLNNGTSYQLRCVAKNTVKNQPKSEYSLPVAVSKHGAAIRTGIIVGVVVGVVILVIIGVLVYIFCFRK